MSEQWNPNAMPFRPGGYPHREQHFGGFENQLPPPPPPPRAPYGPPGAPWNGNNYAQPPPPPPPQPPQHMYGAPLSYNEYEAYQHAQAYHKWMQQNGYNAPPPPPPQQYAQPGPDAFAPRPNGQYMQQPYAQQTFGQQSYGHQPYRQQPYAQRSLHGAPPALAHHNPNMFANRASYHSMQAQTNVPFGGKIEDIQAPTPPGKKSKSGTPANGQAKQKDAPKAPKPSTPAGTGKKGKYGDEKIMLPAPQPTQEYLDQAAGEPSVSDPPAQLLVVLDLNGTVLFRPNRNAKTMIERPFLKPFLRYLFQNFKVMVWSSAKPDNVKSLVNQALDNDLRSKLVAQWARDSFGLSPTNYQQNVQVYKNLKLVWSRSQIQSYHPDYETGGRFGQHNTILIDDSSIKASAQPHNLLEIPEFSATPEQMQGDVLREVAGYLETLRKQSDVSQFINKEPFKGDGRWTFDWPDSDAGGGEMTSKVSAGTPSKKKNNKKKQNAAAAAESRTQTPAETRTQTPAETRTQTPITKVVDAGVVDSMASVSLASSVTLPASVQKDW